MSSTPLAGTVAGALMHPSCNLLHSIWQLVPDQSSGFHSPCHTFQVPAGVTSWRTWLRCLHPRDKLQQPFASLHDHRVMWLCILTVFLFRSHKKVIWTYRVYAHLFHSEANTGKCSLKGERWCRLRRSWTFQTSWSYYLMLGYLGSTFVFNFQHSGSAYWYFMRYYVNGLGVPFTLDCCYY